MAKQAIDAGDAYRVMEQVTSAATAFTDDAAGRRSLTRETPAALPRHLHLGSPRYPRAKAPVMTTITSTHPTIPPPVPGPTSSTAAKSRAQARGGPGATAPPTTSPSPDTTAQARRRRRRRHRRPPRLQRPATGRGPLAAGRAALLRRVAARIEAERDELALIETLESGKPISQAKRRNAGAAGICMTPPAWPSTPTGTRTTPWGRSISR